LKSGKAQFEAGLNDNSAARISERVQVARENTWEERVQRIEKAIAAKMEEKALALGSPGESPHGEALPVREHRLPELLDSILTFLARHTYIPKTRLAPREELPQSAQRKLTI